MSKKPRSTTDWEAVELLYRPGVMSLRAIASAHDCTEGAIRKRAKQFGWTRDLNAKVRAKAEELVRKAEVRNEVRNGPEAKESERQQIDVSAQLQANVVLRHRSAIGRHQNLVDKMLTELEALVDNPEAFAALGTLLYAPDENGRDKLNELYHKVIAMPGRVDSAKKLVETLEKLVKMERESFGLNDAAKGDEDPMAGGRTITDAERAVRLLHFLRAGGVSE